MPIVHCASCGVKLDVPPKKIGTAVVCPSCKGHVFAARSICCPDCGSDNCQRMQMVHDMGTSKSRGSGLGTGGVGLEIGTAITSLFGSSQSNLAAQCAPPKKDDTSASLVAQVMWVLVAIVGLCAALFSLVSVGDAERALGAWIVFGFGTVVLIFAVYMANGCVSEINEASRLAQENWERALAEWQKKFICLKCGQIWIP